MSIDERTRHAAAALTEATTGSVPKERLLARIAPASRRRTRNRRAAAVAAMVTVIACGLSLLRPYSTPVPPAEPLPSPAPTVQSQAAGSLAMVTPNRDGNLLMLDVETRVQRTVQLDTHLSSIPWGAPWGARLSPDGADLAVPRGGSGVDVRAPMTSARRVLETDVSASSLAWSPDATQLAVVGDGVIDVLAVSDGAIVHRIAIADSDGNRNRTVSFLSRRCIMAEWGLAEHCPQSRGGLEVFELEVHFTRVVPFACHISG